MVRRFTAQILLIFAALGLSVPDAHAQTGPPSDRVIQAGLGIVPGVGVQAAYLSPWQIITREGVLYVDWSPKFTGGDEATVQLSGSVGGSLRVLGLVRLFNPQATENLDLDVGLRIGPSLFFSTRFDRVEKNQRFTLFLEPYVRLTSSTSGNRTLFVEVGSQRPHARAGVWFNL